MCVCVCVCVCVCFGIYVLNIFSFERCFYEIKMVFGFLVELHVWLHSYLCFSFLEKLFLNNLDTSSTLLDRLRYPCMHFIFFFVLHFKNKLRQFSEHALIQVFLMMVKSLCTCTCIKSSKEYCVLCLKNIARLHKCIHVMTIWDMRKSL